MNTVSGWCQFGSQLFSVSESCITGSVLLLVLLSGLTIQLLSVHQFFQSSESFFII